jgi:hypothetical protein
MKKQRLMNNDEIFPTLLAISASLTNKLYYIPLTKAHWPHEQNIQNKLFLQLLTKQAVSPQEYVTKLKVTTSMEFNLPLRIYF